MSAETPDPGYHGDVVGIPKDQWTTEMHRKAALAEGRAVIGPHGPENHSGLVHPGQIGQKEVPAAGDAEQGDDYSHLTDPNYEGGSVEEAGRRLPSTQGPIARETEQQMGIAAADRAQREQKGMPPPSADLR